MGFDEDKIGILKTNTGLLWDKDIYRTYSGHIADICWTWDKVWTKVGIPTLSTSTEIPLTLHRIISIPVSHSHPVRDTAEKERKRGRATCVRYALGPFP